MNNEPDFSAAASVNLPGSTSSNFLTRPIAWARTSEGALVLTLTLLCFITRLLAVPASLWEWDDILFAKALHHYNLPAHSPHPPGFPVFVAMGRVAYWILRDEHRALVAVALLFTTFLAPALYYFYREIFRDRRIAVAGALLGSVAPNILIHGTGGRSDGPALVLALLALTLVLRGLHSRAALLAGCVVFGLGMGVRVTLLPIVAPTLAIVLLARLWRRQWRLSLTAIAAAGVAALCWYVPLVVHTGWAMYRAVVNAHANYTYTVDSIFANTENAIWAYRLQRFFLDIWGAGWMMWTIYTLAALGLLTLIVKRQWRALGFLLLAFVPFIIFTLILNTPLAAPVYSLPFVPFFTGLAACGLILLPRLLLGAERSWIGRNIGLLAAIIVTILFARWTQPITRMLHREISPPLRAVELIRATLNPQRDVLAYDGAFTPHLDFYLPELKRFKHRGNYDFEDPPPDALNPTLAPGHIYTLTLEPVPGYKSQLLEWSSERARQRLKPLTLGRYFQVYLTDLTTQHTIGYSPNWGWHGEDPAIQAQWASPHAAVFLPRLHGTGQLQMTLQVPTQPDGTRARVKVQLGQRVLDEFAPPADWFVKTYEVPADWHGGRVTQLTLTAAKPFLLPNGDERRIGMYVRPIVWRPAE